MNAVTAATAISAVIAEDSTAAALITVTLVAHAVGCAATTTTTSAAACVDSTASTDTAFTLSFRTCQHWAIFSLAT